MTPGRSASGAPDLVIDIDPEYDLDPGFIDEWRRSPMCPRSGHLTFITGYHEGSQVLRSRSFRTNRFTAEGTNPVYVVVGDDRSVRFADPDADGNLPAGAVDWATVIAGGDTLSSLHGEPHRQRRRALSALFGRNSHQWYRETVIDPVIRRNLQAALDTAGADGVVRLDLVPFAHRLFVQLTAKLVGLDGVETAEGADDLAELFERMHASAGLTVPREGLTEKGMTDSLWARDEFKERYFDPSRAVRAELVARYERGELAEAELPRDYLTLVARGADTFDTEASVFNQTFPLFNGSTGTSTSMVLHTLDNLLTWFEQHPGDRARQNDPEFLQRALRETIRLQNPGLPAITRMAIEDVELPSGRRFAAGDVVNLLLPATNRDPSVFAEKADEFDLGRTVPSGVHDYALGFGGGVHMCPATPLVLGEGGISGTVVPAVAALLEAGIERDRPEGDVRRPAATDPFEPPLAVFPARLHRR